MSADVRVGPGDERRLRPVGGRPAKARVLTCRCAVGLGRDLALREDTWGAGLARVV